MKQYADANTLCFSCATCVIVRDTLGGPRHSITLDIGASMTNTVIDVNGLASALEQRVKADGISWRQAAGQIGVSPSLLTRVRNDQRPDLDAYARIVRWLRISADVFMIDPEELESREEPELGSSINALLRARSDLDEQDKEHLTNILSQGLVYFQQTRKPS